MLANKRIVSATGLINNEIISIITKSTLIPAGTPGGLNKWLQKCLLALIIITIKETKANAAVTAILPVKFAPDGIKPNILFTQIKKNIVSNRGMKRMYLLPKFGLATSSLTNTTTISKKF